MTIAPFTYTAHPARVLFGEGTLAQLSDEVRRLGAARALVLCTPQQEAQGRAIAAQLGGLAVGVLAVAAMHTPTDITDRAARHATAQAADLLVAVGGGSTTGLSKAIALRTGMPQIIVPTTYAGSEMTPILGETSGGRKVTQTNAKVLPQVVIYDVALTMGLPPALSGTSGINAMAHAIEALYARDSNPVTSLLALDAIGALVAALPAIAADPGDRHARFSALYGAWLCGICLGTVGMALHHKLCHTLGGSFDLPHSETHTILLPHALAYNAPAIPAVMAKLGAVLGPDPAVALQDLCRAVGAPVALRDLGMPRDGIARAVELALANPYWNPRPLAPGPLATLITRAWAGDPPRTAPMETSP